MAYRELFVMDIREVLRLWVAGQGYRRIAALGQVDRKTARRYIDAAIVLGLERGGGDGQLSDAFIGQVAHMLRPGRPHDPGAMRTLCRAHQERIQGWAAQDIAVPKMVVPCSICVTSSIRVATTSKRSGKPRTS